MATLKELMMDNAGVVSILRIDFAEVYRRHLARHSQRGINVLHLIAVYGVYYSVFSIAAVGVSLLLPDQPPIGRGLSLFLLSLPWLGILGNNVPLWPLVMSILSSAFLSAAAATFPIPWWLAFLLLPAWHQLQQLSHRWYTVARDMSGYQQRYPKGRRLVVMLAVFELPILLNYFLIGDIEGDG
jgi:hypothetical protein